MKSPSQLLIFCISPLLWLSPLPALAQQEVFVIGDRPQNELELNNYDNKTSNKLNAQSEIHSAPQGGTGQVNNLFLRGAAADKYLVFVDGVLVNDPSGPSGGFDFGSLDLDDVETLEILKGPQGVKYGSGALAGVIKISTKKTRKKNKAKIKIEGGGQSQGLLATTLAKRTKRFFARLHGKVQTLEGFSSANEKYHNREADGHRAQLLHTQLEWTPSAISQLSYQGRQQWSETEIDRGGGLGNDDPNSITKGESTLQSVTYKRVQDSHRQELTIATFYYTRRDTNDPDLNDTTHLRSNYQAKTDKLDFTSQHLVVEDHWITFGLGHHSEQANFFRQDDFVVSSQGTQANQRSAVSLQWQAKHNHFQYLLGQRQEWTTDQLVAPAWQAQIERPLNKKWSATFSLAQAGKIPTLYQRFDQKYGNQSLATEKVLGGQLELAYQAFNIRYSIEPFYNHYTDLIDMGSDLRYINLGAAITRGIDFSASQELSWGSQLRLGYSYLEAFDLQKDEFLLRRPSHKITGAWQYSLSDQLSAKLSFQYIGRRWDIDPNSFARVRMPEHSTFALSGEYKINSSWQIFSRIENLFNRKYEVVRGFGTPPLSLFAGLQAEI